jgi:gamma-glutamylcyclotransferase
LYPLHFAYGSNLDVGRMRARCPSAEPLETAVLQGYRLAFRGYSPRWGGAVATLVEAPRATVSGVLYRLPPGELARLDRFEGAPAVYRRIRLSLRDECGHRRRAQAYVLTPGRAFRSPASTYLLTILGAYNALGFDATPLLRAAFTESA